MNKNDVYSRSTAHHMKINKGSHQISQAVNPSLNNSSLNASNNSPNVRQTERQIK